MTLQGHSVFAYTQQLRYVVGLREGPFHRRILDQVRGRMREAIAFHIDGLRRSGQPRAGARPASQSKVAPDGSR